MPRTPVLSAAALVLLLAPAPTSAPPTPAPATAAGADTTDAALIPPGGKVDAPITAPADHHLHAWSADAVGIVGRLQEALGQEVIPPEKQQPLDGGDAVAMLDSAGIDQGVLLSTAYFFAIPDVEVEDERARVRDENDYVARQVRAHPDRLVGFASVNPLSDYALEEIERIAGLDGITGLKLHLANSDVSLRNDTHVQRLREVFARAEALDLPVAIHLYTRHPDYGRQDAEIFLEEVLPAAPSVPVQVAHLGGGGGYGPGTQGVVEAFAAAFRSHPDRTAHVFFDLSGTAQPESLAKGDSALVERIREINAGVAGAVRTLGPDRVVFGTDWPLISAATYVAGLREALPLEDEALRDLLDDGAPYLDAPAGSANLPAPAGPPAPAPQAGAATSRLTPAR